MLVNTLYVGERPLKDVREDLGPSGKVDGLHAFDRFQKRWERRSLETRKGVHLEHTRSHIDRSHDY